LRLSRKANKKGNTKGGWMGAIFTLGVKKGLQGKRDHPGFRSESEGKKRREGENQGKKVGKSDDQRTSS